MLLMLTVFAASCGKDESENPVNEGKSGELSTDTYQESKRSYSDGNVTFKFSSSVKLFSEYQLSKIQNVKDDSVLYFPKDMESTQYLKIGDIYVLNDKTEEFPFGFVGKVITTKDVGNQIEVVTSNVPIKEVFDDLKFSLSQDLSECPLYDENDNIIETTISDEPYDDSEFEYTETEEGDEEDDAFVETPALAPRRIGLSYFKEIRRDMTFLEYKHGNSNFKATGTIGIKGGVDAKVDLLRNYARIEVSATARIAGSLSGSIEHKIGFNETKKHVGKIIVPVHGVPIITVPVSFYYYTVNNASIKLHTDVEFSVSPSFCVTYQDGKFSETGKIGSKKEIFKNVKLSGTLSYGQGIRSYTGLGLAKWSVVEWKSAYIDAIGLIDANTSVDLWDVYEGHSGQNLTFQALNNAQFKIHATGGVYLEKEGILKFFGKKLSDTSKEKIIKRKVVDITLGTLYLLPQVSAWSKNVNNKSATITHVLSRSLLIPINTGMALYQGVDCLKKLYDDQIYWFVNSGTQKSFTFSSLKDGDYTVYPIYRILGIEIQDPNGYDFSIESTLCPDSNHPHMIDLGLPSGTLWACCNVGASKPEEYGGYYAWGETKTKSVYNWYTYSYWHDSDGDDYVDNNELTNIGSDIAGTSYDAATANWGAPWRMPTKAQIQELLDNTTSGWTTQNGVYGRKFTGSNGGTVFLPAAGHRWDEGLDGEGSGGLYWSSSLVESYPYCAYYLNFYSGGAGWYYGYYGLDDGHSVRPVRKN